MPPGVAALVLLLLVSGEGFAQQQASAQHRGYTTVQLRGYVDPIRLDSMATWNEVLQPPGQAFAAVRHVLDSLQIPIPIADSARGLLHNPAFTVRTRLAGKAMSRLMHCGTGMTGDYADTYRITIAYAVMIDPLPDGHSRLGIAMVSNGQHVAGVSTEAVMCGTTGVLEQTILKATQLEMLKRNAS